MRAWGWLVAVMAGLVATAAPAGAEEQAKGKLDVAATVICPAGLICAAEPEGVAKALQDAGYKAELGKSDATGNPRIGSAANGYSYDLFFYGCTKGRDCDSLGFSISFVKDSANSAELANLWNKDERFSTMSFDPADGTLSITYDVSTVGGLSRANFADVVDWWAGRLARAKAFFDEHPAKPKA